MNMFWRLFWVCLVLLIVCFGLSVATNIFEISDKGNKPSEQHIKTKPPPEFMLEPVKGVSLFYLDGRDQEDLPQLFEKLYRGETACKGTTTNIEERLISSLQELKDSGVNWVRLLIGKGFYDIYKNRCNFDMQQVYPSLAKTHVEAINHFLSFLTRPEFNFNIELVLGGSKDFADIDNDVVFFESILTQIDKTNVNMVMLGGDVQPSKVPQHAKWIKQIFNYFDKHANTEIRLLNYSFDTVTYRTADDIRDYLRWVKLNLPELSVVTLNLYVHLPKNNELPEVFYYHQVLGNALELYRESGIEKPLWIDEFGFKLDIEPSDLGKSYQHQAQYYESYFSSTLCANNRSTQQSVPGFLWVVGNDRYLSDLSRDGARTPFGLFSGFSASKPITQPSWNIIQKYYENTECNVVNADESP
jgi:hypothetical protein